MVLPGFAGRVRMYVMLIGYVACFKIPRFAINTLIPFVVRDMGLPTSLTPTLLAAFHPGYICSQIPGAAVVRRSGPKYLATLQLAGCAVFMAAMPWAGNIKSRGVAVASLSALMACLGVVQGPMSPVISQLQGAWMPTGVERAIAFRFTGLAHTAAPLFGALLTTRIGDRYGWRAVCYCYAAFAAAFTFVWASLASDRPVAEFDFKKKPASSAPKPPAAATPQLEPEPEPEPAASEVTVTDREVLLSKPSIALACFHIAFNFLDQTRHQLSPTIYMEKFGCTPVQMGTYLAIGNACHVPANFLWGTLESVLISRGTSTLRIRKMSTGVGSYLEALLAMAYGLAPNPFIATVVYGFLDATTGLHGSGGWANYMEVGGEDTAMLNATWNTIACCLPVVVPFLGFWLRARSGSWLPQLVLAAIAKIVTGTLYMRWAGATAVRTQLLEEKRAAAKAAAAFK